MSREEILALGHHYLNDGLYEEAYKCYNELKNMGLYSRSINIYLKVAEILERGDQYLILGERDEARECYKQLESKDIYKDYNYGFPVLVLKIYYEKILFLKQMANTSNDDLKTIYKVIKANAYLKNGLFDKASNIYKKLISSYECPELGVSGFAAAKINNGELAKAKDCFDNKKHLLSKKFYTAIKFYIEYKRKGEYEQMLKRMHKNISLYHINERHMNNCDENVGIFNDDVNIEKVYDEVINAVKDDKTPYSCGYISYHVSFSEPIGKTHNRNTNCVRVFSFIEKGNVVTIFPCVPTKTTLKVDAKVKRI